MVCRSCGANIAEKAIVCYRCGAPTADPVVPSRAAAAGPSRWPMVLVMLVVVALGAWLIPETPPGSPERIGAWVVVWLVVFGVIAWARRRRR